MKYLSNFSIMSAMANVKRVCFVLFGAAMLYVTPSLLCSCSGSSKGNSGNGDNGNNAAEQQAAEPVKSEKEQALENAYKAMARLSYAIFRYDITIENKTTIDKDGFQNVPNYFRDGITSMSPFAFEHWRHVYIDGNQISYNPKFTADDLSIFVMKEVVFILTKKSLQGDPMVSKRNKEIDISQYLYYLVFGNEDANDFVKERVQMHYEVAMEQMLDEINYVYEVANSSASSFTFKFEPSLYKDKFKINIWFDDNGYLVVCSSLWL
jgi:hypothetical protein